MSLNSGIKPEADEVFIILVTWMKRKPNLKLPNSTLDNGEGICVYNEILLETPIVAEDDVALILIRTMEETVGVFLKTGKVKAKVVIADSWAEK